MHRAAGRPLPLEFPLLPARAAFAIDPRKDLGYPTPQTRSIYLEAPIRDGLHTPPADEMGTTYQQPQFNTYGNRNVYSASGSAPPGDYAGACSGSSQGRPYPAPHSSLNPLPSSSASSLRNEVQIPQPANGQPPSPQASGRSSAYSRSDEPPARKITNSDLIVPNLQIPSSINDSGGSLAEFAAQITCLFWFESPEIVHQAERVSPSTFPIRRLRDEAIPCSGFRKWVVTVLTTTQVTQNVILLALLFIYRLKKINPAVNGRIGSEFRLLTVALMLGNKFLDDNTYTNKTWAEVSGISVTEIHVMEVEFLSNMRYSLLASKEQWQEWQGRLGKFWLYCDEASRAPLPQISPLSTLPPTSLQAASPPSLTSGYPASQNGGNHHYSQPWSHNYAAPGPSPGPTMPEQDLRASSRKRSYDGKSEESAAKRVTRPTATTTTITTTTTTTAGAAFNPNIPAMRPDLPRLPVPHLTISTSQPPPSSYNPHSAMSQNVPVLPPLNQRAMSSVYPTTPSWAPSLPILTPTRPSSHHGPPDSGGYSTPSRRTSPHSVHELLSLGSSPISGKFPGGTPGHISPSVFYQSRNSPYKPVRHVNTLLYPPPSASMQGYSANVNQMHYQPLGRRNDYRSGVVPEYTSHAPYQQNYPILPQPNFHP
ncbi:hypothetical protein BJ875DRAFT_125786 [Amylocarpus encephaloides]|uniref:Uncharacterized protein n=1 Tax=Amylocarpus encephaloides TaxID=45428 RepID=A0A9P7YPU8_9HELO|nr:hypothetical protein BJ875DRAFT_125786 [Amylocarpus encephaloides]